MNLCVGTSQDKTGGTGVFGGQKWGYAPKRGFLEQKELWFSPCYQLGVNMSRTWGNPKWVHPNQRAFRSLGVRENPPRDVISKNQPKIPSGSRDIGRFRQMHFGWNPGTKGLWRVVWPKKIFFSRIPGITRGAQPHRIATPKCNLSCPPLHFSGERPTIKGNIFFLFLKISLIQPNVTNDKVHPILTPMEVKLSKLGQKFLHQWIWPV